MNSHNKAKIDVAWLAGLLEGDGSFGWHQTVRDKGHPRIQLQMADRDVIDRVAKLFNTNILGPYSPYHKWQKKQTWFAQCSCDKAVKWMRLIYPFMGKRRKIVIKRLIKRWRTL